MNRPPAILSFLWPNFSQILHQLLATEGEFILLAPANKNNTDFVQHHYRSSGRIHLFNIETIIDHPKIIDNALQPPLHTSSLHQVTDIAVPLHQPISEAYLDMVRKEILQSRTIIDTLDCLLNKFDIRLLLLNEDVMNFGRTITSWSHSRKIRSLLVSHAIPLHGLYTIHGGLHSDSVAVYGNREREAWEDIGLPANRVHVTGNPYWDDYPRLRAQRHHIRTQLAERHSFSLDNPLVVFAPTWEAGLTFKLEREISQLTLAAFLRSVDNLRQRGVKITPIIKERPSATGFDQADLERLLSTLEISNAEHILLKDFSKPWVVAADLIIGVNSNILVEALMAETPAINILTDSALRLEPTFDAHSGIVDATPDNLSNQIEKILYDKQFRCTQLALMRDAAPKYNIGADGGATRRLCDLILDLADLHERNADDEPMSALPISLSGMRTVVPARDIDLPWEPTSAQCYPHNPRAELLALYSGVPLTAIDIGCNTGATLSALKQRHPDCRTIGIEINQVSADIARQYVDEVISLPVSEVSWTDHGIQEGSVDLIIMADVIEHLPNPWRTLATLKALLAPQGILLASIPNAQNLWLLDHIAGGQWTYSDDGLLDKTHLRFFTKTEIIRCFERCGFNIDRIERNIDGRLRTLFEAPYHQYIRTERILVAVNSTEEKDDLATLQFIIAARKDDEALFQSRQATGEFLRPYPADDRDRFSRQFTPVAKPDAAITPRLVRVGLLSEEYPLGACFDLRIRHILSSLAPYLEVIHIATLSSSREWKISEKEIESCDLFIIQRAFPSPQHSKLIEKVKNSGRPTIYETDDLLDELPVENAEFSTFSLRIPYLRRFLPDASIVIASTEALVEHYENRGLTSRKFCNYLPRSIWDAASTTHPSIESASNYVTIGFAGTIARGRDLSIIEEALLRIVRLYGNRVRIVLWGASTENLRAADDVSIVSGTTPYPLYPRRLASLGFDIGLIPLEDTPYNRCKSDLKWLEYSALGIASVVSDVPVYAEAKEHGLAVVVPNEADAWFAALVQLIEDEHGRKALGRRAQDYVREHRSLEGHIHEYAEILNTVLPPHLHLPVGEALKPTPLRALHSDEIAIPADIYRTWAERRTIQEVDAEVLAERMVAWPHQPQITLFSVAHADEFELLAQTTDALKDQLYPGWRFVVISDQPSPDPIFEQAEFLGWIQVDTLDDPAGLAELGNALLEQAGGDLFAWLPAGTRLTPDALLLITDRFMQADTAVAAVYSDHDYYDHQGSHRPQLKPTFDLEWLRCADYIGPAIFFKTADVLALGGFQPYGDAMMFDVLLRTAEHPEVTIAHQADVLLSIPNRGRDDNPVARQVAVERHLQRSGSDLKVLPGLLPATFRLEPRHRITPAASIIVAVRDVFHLVERCLESLFSHTDYPDFEVVVVDNGSEDPDIGCLYTSLRDDGRRLRVVEAPGEFSHAHLLNEGALVASGEVFAFIHADCEFRDPAWLGRLVDQATRQDVGVVCPLVLQPEFGFVDSAGLFLGGTSSGFATARPALRGLQMSDEGYMGMLHTTRTVSAASSVGLTVSRDRFRALDGFDEKLARSQFEIDFCLRAAARNWKAIYLPHARVIHHGGAIVGRLLDTPAAHVRHATAVEEEQRALLGKWASTISSDPYASPHFSMTDGNVRLESDIPLAWQTGRHNRARALGFPIVGGSGEYRVRLPFRGLVEAGWMHAENVPASMARAPSVAEMLRLAPDVVLLHQRFARNVEEAVRGWKEAMPALRVVFGMDDRSDAIPFKSSVYHTHKKHNPDARNRMRKMMTLADAIAVSTEPLAELARELAGDVDVRVIPNSLERKTWEPLRSARRPRGKPRVGWIGAQQHRGDLELIIPVLEATHDEVDWVFMGMWLPEFQGLVKEKHPWVDFQDYPKAIASLDLDLAIAPLEVNEFNEAKSNLRLLEYGAVGYPVVCTDIYPYRTDAPPVTHLANEPSRWIEAILDKVQDRDALQQEGTRLREWVMSRYLLEHHLPAWNDILLGT